MSALHLRCSAMLRGVPLAAARAPTSVPCIVVHRVAFVHLCRLVAADINIQSKAVHMVMEHGLLFGRALSR